MVFLMKIGAGVSWAAVASAISPGSWSTPAGLIGDLIAGSSARSCPPDRAAATGGGVRSLEM